MNPQITAIVKQMWNKDWTLKSVVLSAILIVLMFITHISAFGFLFFIVTFTWFDVIGFNLTASDAAISVPRIGYRVIQNAFMICLLLILLVTCGWVTVVASLVGWWFCVCDRLYYLLQNDVLTNTEYTWLEGWSIFAVLKQFGVKAMLPEFNTATILGILIGLTLTILF